VRIVRKIELAKTLGPDLQGRLLGRKHFGQACETLADAPPGEVVVLDFRGVDLMTGSWANEMIVPLYKWASDPRNDFFPILHNLKDRWDEELQLLADWNQQCYLWVGDDLPGRARLIGVLDPGYRKTLEAVLRFKQITGAELERKFPDESVGATAWNNRLKDLNTKRLLVRTKRGREQVYSPVTDGIFIHG
jgi:hypothetical protein